jgi:hypothetical protein
MCHRQISTACGGAHRRATSRTTNAIREETVQPRSRDHETLAPPRKPQSSRRSEISGAPAMPNGELLRPGPPPCKPHPGELRASGHVQWSAAPSRHPSRKPRQGSSTSCRHGLVELRCVASKSYLTLSSMNNSRLQIVQAFFLFRLLSTYAMWYKLYKLVSKNSTGD